MSDDEFEALVGTALDEIPDDIFAMMDNVAIFIEDEFTPELGEPENGETLGIYEGVALTERDEGWAAGALPDRIVIFKNPTLRICDSHEDVVHEIGVTVVHEIAHHFGIDDAKLHDLGWG